MIVFDNFSAVDHEMKQAAADWVKKGDVALFAFSQGKACDCANLLSEVRSAIVAALKQGEDVGALRQVEIVARTHTGIIRAKQRIEAAIHVAIDAGARGEDLIDWTSEIYQHVYTSRAARRAG